MPFEPDGKDYIVQMTQSEGGEWTTVEYFADVYSAKQHAMHVLHGGSAASVRVVQTRLYGWRRGGSFGWDDDIGERDDRDRT